MKSMTGFGSASLSKNSVQVEVRIRCLNSRFFEARFNLPPEYLPFENEIRKRVQKSIRRANMDFYVRKTEHKSSSQLTVSANQSFAKKWADEYKKLAKALNLKNDLSLNRLSHLPSVLQVEEVKVAKTWEKQLLLAAIDAAVAKVETQRLREGGAQKKELSSLLQKINSCLSLIGKKRSDANQQLEQRFRKRLEKFKIGDIDPQRLAQEVVIQIDKSDINEELVRLKEHLRSFKQIMIEASGKKLDFYIQELLREFNTIGSKSQITEITQAVVDAKTNIERMREIVQNIE